jgi:flagellar basal-body rod protein FlgG
MIRALYSSATGMVTQQHNIDIISSNVANMNTTGYKKVRATFQDTLYSTIEERKTHEPVNLQVGSGIRLSATQPSFKQGGLQETSHPLDFAIDGPGFFRVRDQQGHIRYTRDGSFKISTEQVGEPRVSYLVTADGEYVLDLEGNAIELEGDGTIPINLISIVTFANPEGLEAIGSNSFAETAASGPARDWGAGVVKQGFLEASNVELAQEMTRLILAQRAYQLSSRVLQSADEMERMANNLRE